MREMPECVWVLDDFESFDNPAVDSGDMGDGSTEYIRADLHDALKEENERLVRSMRAIRSAAQRDAIAALEHDQPLRWTFSHAMVTAIDSALTPPAPKEGGTT